MADDRMKNDDPQRNMGNKEGQNIGQQSPGRTGQGGQQGQHGGQQHTGGQQDEGQFRGQKDSRNLEDDEFGTGGQPGGQNRGGQNR